MSVFDELRSNDIKKVFKNGKSGTKGTIIKGTNVRCTSSKTINPYQTSSLPHGEGRITPLLDGDNVIGIIYECACGELARILFDFEEDVG